MRSRLENLDEFLPAEIVEEITRLCYHWFEEADMQVEIWTL